MRSIPRKTISLIMCMLLLLAIVTGCSDGQTPYKAMSVEQSILAETVDKVVKVNASSKVDLANVGVPNSVVTGEKAEISVNLTGFDGNPYDFEEIDVYGEFVAPSGKVLTLPAFYYQDYDMSLAEYDYTKEFPLKKWYGNAKGVFDAEAGRGVVKIAPTDKTQYITQTQINLNKVDVRSTNVFFDVKQDGDVSATGYHIGFYSNSTGKSLYYKIPAESITNSWVRVVVPISAFNGFAEDISIFTMDALKFFGLSDSAPTGSILIKDFGMERPTGTNKFATIVDKFEVEEYSEYIASNNYNGFEVLTKKATNPNFIIRFKAEEAGEYKYRVTIKEKGDVTAKYTSKLTATANSVASKGVIKVEPTLKRNFVYADGDPFLAIGENTGWYTTKDAKTYEYYNMFENMSAVGMNWSRVFMLDYQFALQNYTDGTNNFDSRQDQAYRLDKVIEKAEKEDIYVALVLLVHGQFYEELQDESGYIPAWPCWNSNPFNVNCGGYLKKPWEFFTSERAKADFKKIARYVVARWGYSDNIFAWELWNEVNHLVGYDENHVDSDSWHSEMAQYIKGIDAYGHMVTSSIGRPLKDDSLNAVPELDYNNVHAYVFENYSSTLVAYNEYMLQKFNKPVLISEIGIGGDNGTVNFQMDPSAIYITQSIWSGSFSAAGGGMTWWWDNVSQDNLYYLWKPINNYFKEVDKDFVTMPNIVANDYKYASSIPDTVSSTLVNVKGYKDDTRVYAYMFDSAYNSYNINTTIFDSTVLTFKNMANGVYSVKLFNTATGDFIALENVTVSDGNLGVAIGSWKHDIAILVEKNK